MSPAATLLGTWAGAALIGAQTVAMFAWWFYDTLEVVLVRQREKLVEVLAGGGASQWLLAVDILLLGLLGLFAAITWRRVFFAVREFASGAWLVAAAVCSGLSIAVPAIILACLFGTLLDLAARDHPSVAQVLNATSDIWAEQAEKLAAQFGGGGEKR